MTQAAILAASGSPGTTTGFKNRIINGAMVIDQRNSGASVTPSSTGTTYTLDRWFYAAGVASKFTIGQNLNSVTPPVGFTKYLGCSVASAYSIGSSDYFLIGQTIEGFNIADLAWGTANAKTVTLSFWVYSSLTGTFGGSLKNDSGTRSYPFSYTISSANTWTQISITIAGETSGTWNTGNTGGVTIQFSLGVGSSQAGTAGVWSSSNLNTATGAQSVVGTNGATFYVTGAQFEVGTTATNFDFRSYTTELALCQRYYNKAYVRTGYIGVINSNLRSTPVPVSFPSTMRATPTVVSGFVNEDSGADGGFEITPNVLTLKVYNANTTGYASVYWNYTATAEL